MDTKSYYAMTFYNTTDTMQTEKKAKALFPIRVMPTPRAVSVSCGLAIRFEGEDIHRICKKPDRSGRTLPHRAG